MSGGAPDGYRWSAPQRLRGIGGSNHYVDDLVIPANTSVATPEMLAMTLVKGWVASIKLIFPPGPAALAHVVVWDKDGQLFPSDSSQDFHLDNVIVDIPCDFDTKWDGVGYRLYFFGWNDDDTWPHTIQCHVWVIPY